MAEPDRQHTGEDSGSRPGAGENTGDDGRADPRRPPRDAGPTGEGRQTIWLLTISPTIWAVHFLACYLTGAIYCAKVGVATGSLGWVPAAVAGYTAIALVGIGATAWIGWRRHEYGTAAVPHDFDTSADRHRFLGFATVLLSGLSGVAVAYVAVVAAFFRTCR